MTNQSNVKNLITKLKNRIINALHETDVDTLIAIAKTLKIRISPELSKISKGKKSNTRIDAD